MSQNVSSDIKNYIEKRANVRTTILSYLDGDDNLEKNFTIQKYFDKLKSQENGIDYKEILNFIRNILNNHHRNQDFFSKIEEMIKYFKEEIKQSFSNSELFNYFSQNKRILHFLFENKMLVIDKQMINILSKPSNNEYFESEIESYYAGEIIDEDDEKKKSGENESFIAKLIREDSVKDFITYITKNNVNLKGKIKKSPFETNSLLNTKEPTLIEYAAFFGAIQIFRYLSMNDVNLTSSLWIYVIHSKNPELIHFLEEKEVEPDDKTYSKCIIEAIKCHHNDIARYFIDNKNQNFNFLESCFEFDNYELIPVDSDSYLGYNLNYNGLLNIWKYNAELVDLLFKESYLDINSRII